MSSTFEVQTQITLNIQYGYSWQGDHGLHYRYRVNRCNGGTITRNQLQRIQETIGRLQSVTEESVRNIFNYDQIKSIEIKGNLNEIEKIPAIFKARCDYYQTEEILLKKSFADSYAYLTQNLQISANPASSIIQPVLVVPDPTSESSDSESRGSVATSSPSPVAQSVSQQNSPSPLPPSITASWDEIRSYLEHESY